MKRLRLLALLFSCIAFAPASWAQEDQGGDEESPTQNENVSDSQEGRRFWQADLPGGQYIVALDRICSVSMQQYLLDGNLVVNEVNIDTTGRSIARFYYIEPLAESIQRGGIGKVANRGKELIDRAAGRIDMDAHNMAQKTYPATTHAGMVEYRILDLADLDALFQSALRAWQSGRGRKLSIK